MANGTTTTRNEDGSLTHTVEFTLEAGQVRQIDDDAVSAFDEALNEVCTDPVVHFIDPGRIQTFDAGGPPVWSVGCVPTHRGTLYVTYGFSGVIDPARGACDFELSILVPGPATLWPGLLLRALCRYMLGSGRTLEVGESMLCHGPISRFFVPPERASELPDTPMVGVTLTPDPMLPGIYTSSGSVNVRRVFGVHRDEMELMDLWSPEGFMSAIGLAQWEMATDITRASMASNPHLIAMIEKGSAKHGSEVPYVAVPGVSWSYDGETLRASFPGGEHARRIRRMIRARLPFGRSLLVQDTDPENQRAVAFEVSDADDPNFFAYRSEGPVLVYTLPADTELFDTLENVEGPRVEWAFRV